MIFFKPNKIKTNLQRFWALYNNHTGCPASPDGWCAPPPSRCWCLLAGDFLDGVLSALDGRTSTAEGGGGGGGGAHQSGWLGLDWTPRCGYHMITRCKLNVDQEE